MNPPPPWWNGFSEYASARYHPAGAVAILREMSRLMIADPALTPHSLRLDFGTAISPIAERVSNAYFIAAGLALPSNDDDRRLTDSLDKLLSEIPKSLYSSVAQYNSDQLLDRGRRTRANLRTLSPITLKSRIRVLRDLGQHLTRDQTITGWAEVTASDLDTFLAARPHARHQRTYVLRRYFAWAKRTKHVLVDPAQNLTAGTQPGFTGTVLTVDDQRALVRRWTDEATPSHERAIGLLSLLHAASNAEIRTLTTAGVDHQQHRIHLRGRPAPIPLDPATWAAILACIADRDLAGVVANPHVIVSRATRCRESPVHSTFICRQLVPAAVTPMRCRQTRILALVTQLDPKLIATVLGMQDTALLHYRGDTVDRDLL